MKNEERRAATRELRRQLEEIRNAIAANAAVLTATHAHANPRARIDVTPRARERFELLCTVPVIPARGGVHVPSEFGVRC